MVSVQESAEKQDFKMMFLAAIVTSMVFVVGLFWNEAMRAAVEILFPARDTLSVKFATALIVTTIVAFALFVLYRSLTFAERAQKGVINQMSKLKIELDKQRKEAERRQKQLEKVLAKATRNL